MKYHYSSSVVTNYCDEGLAAVKACNIETPLNSYFPQESLFHELEGSLRLILTMARKKSAKFQALIIVCDITSFVNRKIFVINGSFTSLSVSHVVCGPGNGSSVLYCSSGEIWEEVLGAVLQ